MVPPYRVGCQLYALIYRILVIQCWRKPAETGNPGAENRGQRGSWGSFMIRILRAAMAVVTLAALTACGSGDSSTQSKFKAYSGPPITQVVVKKSERKMFLLSGNTVVSKYHVDLGSQPTGQKMFEGDGRTPEGVYYIARQNPNSQYHLSLGISYPQEADVARALAVGMKPGGDIMIHGRGVYNQAQYRPDWTAGCIAVTDKEIEDIFAMVQPGVPIFIYP